MITSNTSADELAELLYTIAANKLPLPENDTPEWPSWSSVQTTQKERWVLMAIDLLHEIEPPQVATVISIKPLPSVAERMKELEAERGKVYGNAEINMNTLGKMFTGALEIYYQQSLPETIPGHVAALMMVLIKVARGSNKTFLQDTYDDLHTYAGFAERCHKEII